MGDGAGQPSHWKNVAKCQCLYPGPEKVNKHFFVAVSYLCMDKDIKAMVNGQYCVSNFWLLSEDYFIPQDRQHYKKLI